MKIIKKQLYTIDVTNNYFKRESSINSEGFDNFILSELKKIQQNIDTFKNYKEDPLTISFVVSNTNNMIASLDGLDIDKIDSEKEVLEGFDNAFEQVAQRLQQAEEKAQEEIANLPDKNIIKGTVLLALIYQHAQISFVVIKFEHEGYWSTNFQHESGIPDSDMQLKVSYLDYQINDSSSYNLEGIYISEKRRSKYWAEHFMQVIPLTDSDKATSNAITELNRTFRSIKNNYPDDYPILYSNYIAYLNSNERFIFNEFCNEVFDKYKQNHPSTKFESSDYVSKLKDKISKKKMQGEFDIIQDIVKDKLIKKSVRINTFFQLRRINVNENLNNSQIKLNEDVICLTKGHSNDEYYLKISVDKAELDKFKEYDYHNILSGE